MQHTIIDLNEMCNLDFINLIKTNNLRIQNLNTIRKHFTI